MSFDDVPRVTEVSHWWRLEEEGKVPSSEGRKRNYLYGSKSRGRIKGDFLAAVNGGGH